jgi:hypothetical protein
MTTHNIISHIMSKNIGEKTAKGYFSSVKKILQVEDLENLEDFIEKTQALGAEEIIKRIDDTGKKASTKVNYYKGFKSLGLNYVHPKKDWGKIRDEGGNCKELTYEKGLEEILPAMDVPFNQLNAELKKAQTDKVKSEYQEDNWTSWNKIEACAKEAQKKAERAGVDMKWGKAPIPEDRVQYGKQLVALQEAVLARLYGGLSSQKVGKLKVQNQPKRSAIIGHVDDKGEFHGTVWDKKAGMEKQTCNYIIHQSGKKYGKWGQYEIHMPFHKNNPSGDEKNEEVMIINDIPTVKSLGLLKKYGYGTGFVFRQQQGGFQNPLNNRNLVNYLQRIFAHDDKKISVNMLRHIYKTDIVKPHYDKVKESEKQMGHKGQVAENYIKN